MAKEKRLSEVLRAECYNDGPDALKAFESHATLRERYPAVHEALEREAEHRHMKAAETLAMARDAAAAMFGELPAVAGPKSAGGVTPPHSPTE